MKRPSFQFYPGDWLNDAALRMCSVGARGLWIDMLCLMHQGSEYGYLKVNHKVILPSNLARMVGSTLQETEGWLEELEGAGVFSKDETGCIFSRRMIRDEEIRQARAAGGIKGGNPSLKAAKEGSEKVGDKVNLPANLQPTPSSSSSSSSSSSNSIKSSKEDLSPADAEDDQGDIEKGKPEKIPYQEIINLYHEVLPEKPRVVKLNDNRRRSLKARFLTSPKTRTLEWWRNYFEAVRERSFLMNGKGDWPGADFDFLITESKFLKIIEGGYQ